MRHIGSSALSQAWRRSVGCGPARRRRCGHRSGGRRTAPPGTPWTFGENSFGQLGNGTTTTVLPRPGHRVDGVIDLDGGREHEVALKSNGTVWTWGNNVEGQQGRGTTANTLTPTQVTSLGTDNVAVETGTTTRWS